MGLIESFCRGFSSNGAGHFLRRMYYKKKLKNIGNNVFINTGVIIFTPKNVELGNNIHLDTNVKLEVGDKGSIKIGDHVHIGSNGILQGDGGLKIGNYVGFAANCTIYTVSNYYEDPNNKNKLISASGMAPKDKSYVERAPVVIEDYAWLGVNTTILPGVKIGKAAVIGANSLVTKDIPAFSIAVGCPARVVKNRRVVND